MIKFTILYQKFNILIYINNPYHVEDLNMAFFDLPNFDDLFARATYSDIFLYTLLWNIGLVGMLTIVLFWIFFGIKIFLRRRMKTINTQQRRQSLLTQASDVPSSQRVSQAQNQNSSTQVNPTKQDKNITQKKLTQNAQLGVVSFITSLFFYLTLILISGIYLSFYAFGKIGHGIWHDILAMAIMSLIVIIPTLVWKHLTKTVDVMSHSQKTFTTAMLLIWVGFSIFLIITTKGICICDFNQKYGVKVRDDLKLSTQWTRSLTFDKVCIEGKVCHMYATLAENASSSVFINVHTATDIQKLTVILQAVPKQNQQVDVKQFQLVNYKPLKYHNIQYIARRNIFSFYFSSLTPDTLYTVIARDSFNNIVYRTNYRTLPSQDTDQLRFVSGGDIGMYQASFNLTANLQQFNPHVIILGGDNAYDDGMRTCYYSWDNLYDMLDSLNAKLNRMVPLIFTIGNHDVGYNALAGVGVDFDDFDNLDYYFMFNPQHTSTTTADSVPQPKQRKSYHHHILGPSIHANIDSGYIQTYENQALFLQQVVNKYPKLYKFANYHNPVYSTCYDGIEGSNDMLVMNNSLKYWTPIFDTGKFVAVFEHHTHYRKFTYKIKGNKVSKDDGVRYVGDGSWGVPQNPCPAHHTTPHPQYFQHMENQHPNHVWKVRIFKDADKNYSIQYKVVNVNNTPVFQATDKL